MHLKSHLGPKISLKLAQTCSTLARARPIFEFFSDPGKNQIRRSAGIIAFSEHGSNNWECEPVLDIIAALDYRAVDACEPL